MNQKHVSKYLIKVPICSAYGNEYFVSVFLNSNGKAKKNKMEI